MSSLWRRSENVEDYISRLAQVDDQFACLIQNLKDSESAGHHGPGPNAAAGSRQNPIRRAGQCR